ncbi:unnamed protein product [Chironomus riparius]|uniref:LITAF domain-containing protein n=1 Tax=Chironomus riparius TaxID=315576 RepID=A0A9N9S4W8_9DIPT|nr:unnamed protein product [Chironomus riparius]
MSNFGKTSIATTCPSCNSSVNTAVEMESTGTTHIVALLLCICFCPLVCCPYLMNCFKTSNHYCPSCKTLLGTYKD